MSPAHARPTWVGFGTSPVDCAALPADARNAVRVRLAARQLDDDDVQPNASTLVEQTQGRHGPRAAARVSGPSGSSHSFPERAALTCRESA